MRGGGPLLLLIILLGIGGCTRQPHVQPGAVISNNPCIDGILAEIAAPGQISGVSIFSHDANSASAPLNWARAIPAMGMSAEEIIALRPRLLLTGNLGATGTNAALEKANIPFLAFGVPVTIADDMAQIRVIARAIGRMQQGEDLVERIERATHPARNAQSRRPSAIIWQAGGFVAGAGTIQDEMLSRAGFRNASQYYGLNQWDILPLEILVRRPPSVIFMARSGQGDDGRQLAMRRKLLRHFGGDVHVVDFPDRLLFCGGPTIIDAMAIMRRAYDEYAGDEYSGDAI